MSAFGYRPALVSATDRLSDAVPDDTLRMDRLVTDLAPPPSVIGRLHQTLRDSDLLDGPPRADIDELCEAAALHVSRITGRHYRADSECVAVPGGRAGLLDTLLSVVAPGQRVVLCGPPSPTVIDLVRLAGGIPQIVPAVVREHRWWVDPQRLACSVTDGTAAIVVGSPADPCGTLLAHDHWDALAATVPASGAWLIVDGAMQRIRFDWAAPSHPALHPDLTGRTVTVGCAAAELRLRRWPVGWVVGPSVVVRQVEAVGRVRGDQPIWAAAAVAVGLTSADADRDVREVTAVWRARAQTVVEQLSGYPVIRPGGGWSLVVDVAQMRLSADDLCRRLRVDGRLAARVVAGPAGRPGQLVRLVFAGEPVHRLMHVRSRFDAALAGHEHAP